MPGIGIGIGIGLSRLNRAAFRSWMSYSDTTLTAVPASDTAMDLAWTNPVIAGVTLKNVVVEISTDGVTFTTSATLGVVTSTQITGLTANTLYYFRLVFVSSRGVRTGKGIIKIGVPFATDLYIASRTGTTLVDREGNNASLLLPTIKTNGNSTYADTGITALANTIWVVKCKINTTAANQRHGAQSVGNNVRLFFGTGTVINTINFGWGDSTVAAGDNKANDFGWHVFIIYDKRFWMLDKDIELTDSSILNIIANIAPTINKTTATWSGTPTTIEYGRVEYPIYIAAEMALSYIGTITDNQITWQAKHIFGGSKAYVYDILSENQIEWINPLYVTPNYSTEASTHILDYGYSQYIDRDNNRELVPYQLTGDPHSNPTVSQYYTFYENVKDNRLFIEDCKIRFQNAFFDRSNTTIYNDNARGATYDPVNPKDWLGYEFNRFFFEKCLNTEYKYQLFVGYDSLLDTAKTEKIALLSTDAMSYKDSVFSYFNDYDAAVTVEQLSLHIDSQNGDKIFGFDATEGTIFYSEDGGVNYNTLAFADAELIGMSYVYSSGRILFLTDTKAYHSVDKLLSIEEISIYDQNGDAFPVVSAAKNFINVRYTDHQILGNGKEMVTFGSYVNVSNNGYVCLFYSIEGESIKTAYTFGQNATYGGYGDPLNPVIARHVHSSTYSEISGKWYWNTGDAGSDPNFECHIFESEYNYITDTWTHNLLLSGDSTSHIKSGALIAKNGYVYMGSDSTGTGSGYDKGMFRATEENINIFISHKRLLDHLHWILGGHLVLNSMGIAFGSAIPFDAGKYKFITYSPRFKFNYNVNEFEQDPAQTDPDSYVAWKLIYVSDKTIMANTMSLAEQKYIYNTIKITIL